MFLTHVYHFKSMFLTVIKLSWLVFCYLISKNLYSLQNAQPFIFQLICIQLCKCLNCFLKTHNKQLNQYSLNFIIFFTQKKVLKKCSGSGQVTGQPVFASSQNNRVWVRFFELGQNFLTRFAMSTCRPFRLYLLGCVNGHLSHF